MKREHTPAQEEIKGEKSIRTPTILPPTLPPLIYEVMTVVIDAFFVV
jgi:hypothetical protein